MRKIEFATSVSLPLDAMTQTFAFLARKGAGKTYAATKLAEEFLSIGGQIIAIDPVGNWYGLRLSAAGKPSKLPVYIFGGDHADLPLAPGSAREIARLLAHEPISAVMDVSGMRKAELVRFAMEFAEELFHRKKSNKAPVHLFLEEAHLFVPQIVMADQARMVGAFQDIIRLGRNYGIGVSMVSQRPQSINKEALFVTECLVVGQVTGLHDRKVIEAWTSEHGVDRGLIGELPSLQVGDVFIWSPGWLRQFTRARILTKKTYDGSFTPKVGEAAPAPKTLAPADIDRITKFLTESIERAKADDPRELRRRIAELEKTAGKADDTLVSAAYADGARAGYAKGVKDTIEAAIKAISAVSPRAEPLPLTPPAPASVARPATGDTSRRSGISTPAAREPHSNIILGKAERAILKILATHGRCTRVRIALLAGYSASGGGFMNAISKLNAAGLITRSGDNVEPTSAGLAAAGPADALPTGAELLRYWQSHKEIGKAERLILGALHSANGVLEKAEVAAATGYEPSGGGFNNAVSRLCTLQLVSRQGNLLSLAEELRG